MKQRHLTIFGAMMLCSVPTFAGLQVGADDSPFQVRYASNLPIGDSVVNVTNTGVLAGVPVEASSLITMDVGTPGVRVLLIKSLRAERETNPSGVTGQAQQEINCSSGEKV
jgi:hypothetical protein